MGFCNHLPNQVSVFNFQASNIRVVTIEGNPWFVADDVCRVLNLLNPTKSLYKLDEDQIALTPIQGIRGGKANLISESGLYRLVMRSDKPEAKSFQDWVTKTGLPAIRKDGGYIMGEEKVVTGGY